MYIGVVFNPRSGSRQGDRLHGMIKAAIISSGHNPLFLDVERRSRLEDKLQGMIQDVDAIAVIGGDGTLNGVVNGILSSSRPEMPVAFFPAGRGKDTARAVPSFSLESLGKKRIDWTTRRQIDVGLATCDDGEKRYFINVSNVGLSAAAAGFSHKLPRQFGQMSYVISAVKAFMTTRAGTARMTIDDSEVLVLDNLLTLAACNGKAVGGGIYIAPDSRIDDGRFQLVAVRNANVLDLVMNLSKLKTGEPFEHPALSSWTARTVRIDNCSLDSMDLDGEMWGSTPVTYSLLPSALAWIGPGT